jgi:hypothetical protein
MSMHERHTRMKVFWSCAPDQRNWKLSDVRLYHIPHLWQTAKADGAFAEVLALPLRDA